VAGTPSVLTPAPGPILPGDSIATAGRKAMWLHVERLLAREPELLDPLRADALRRYRVATRRLRAALRLFGEAYPKADIRRLRRGLAEAAQVVGGVRDLDVRIAGVEQWAGTEDGRAAAVPPLVDDWRRERAEAAEDMARWLASRRHGRWLGSLVTFVDADAEGRPGKGAPLRTIRDWTASRIWSDYEALRSYDPAIRSADRPTLHRVRILGKRLRYDLEFLGDVLGPDQPLLVERLVALQDHLGALNDAALVSAALRGFLEAQHDTLSAGQASAISDYMADREHAAIALQQSVAWVWEPLVVAPFARRLNRTIIAPGR